MTDNSFKVLNTRTVEVPVGSIKPHPKNVNEGDVVSIHESITENGFYGSIIVQESTNLILVGKHRWLAARQAGAKKVPVTFVDCNDDTAINIMLADNRLGRLGQDDPQALAALLDEIAERQGSLIGTGYDESSLEEVRASAQEAMAALRSELNGQEPSDGSLLSLVDVTLDEPRHEVERGDLWHLGQHKLIVAEVLTDWPLWLPHLNDEQMIFAPYPGPFVALADRAKKSPLLMVQPELYIAGHILDRWAEVEGEDTLSKERLF